MRKRILVLGGSFLQVPLIQLAKNRGYYVITCDYLPQHPGHKYADEYHNVSTTDKEGVLALAKRLNIHGIIAFASDPSMPTSAYVARELGLPSPSYDAVETLANKDLFRTFLSYNNFNTPKSCTVTSLLEADIAVKHLKLPIMVKPVDSSGSKGINKINGISELKNAYEQATLFTRCGRIILEEYIEKNRPQIHGDGFVYNNRLVFTCLGDHYFKNDSTNFVPVSTMIPTQSDNEILREGLRQIDTVVNKLQFGTGPINIEMIISKDNKPYILEIGPRNGGNFIPQLMQYATGADMVAWALDAALGQLKHDPSYFSSFKNSGCFSHYILHSENNGIFDSIEIDDKLNEKILFKEIYKTKGDPVQVFKGSNCTIGVMILKYESVQEMNSIVHDMNDFVKINIRPIQ